MPEFQNFKAGKSLLTEGSLVVDVEKQSITLVEEGSGASIPVGRYFAYVVE